tara:strand:+ start:263 stop:673 length:411 start_codon:yes stop_codon:yes gene_type:complete
MENNKHEDKEIQKIIDDITSTAKDLVEEYVSGSDNFVPEEERTEYSENEIRAPYRDDKEDIPFGVTDDEMKHLIKVENEIKDTLLKEPDIYIKGEGKKVDVLRYCQKEGIDNFSILEYIGTDKDKLKLCLKIKTNN